MKKLFSEEYTESQMNLSSEDTAFNLLEDIRCLQEDKAQLTAQVAGLQNELETLRDLLSRSEIDCLGSASEGQIVWPIRDEVIVNISKRLDETPTQSLNTIKAEAIEEAVSAFKQTFNGDPTVHEGELLKYAKQLREKG